MAPPSSDRSASDGGPTVPHPAPDQARTYGVTAIASAAVDELVLRLPTPESIVAEMGSPLDPAGYDWSPANRGVLTADEIFQLTYAAQVEWGTERTFAQLNISRDPVVNRFLKIWLDQEVMHAKVLARVLAGEGASIEPVHKQPKHRWAAVRGNALNRLARRAVGDDFFAVHMSWGAINELTTLRFYAVVRAKTESPLLRSVLRDVMAQEALHYSFYRNLAIRQLAGNPRGQRIVRWVLEHIWTPVGVGLHSRRDVDRIMAGLFAGRPDQVMQMDSQIQRIPGLERLDLIHRTVETASAAQAKV
jgi:rubrerythrin